MDTSPAIICQGPIKLGKGAVKPGKPGISSRQLLRHPDSLGVLVNAQQLPLGPQALKNQPAVATATESSIHITPFPGVNQIVNR